MGRPLVTPDQLLLLWTQDEVRVVCRRPSGLEHHPDLAMRIRGALGRQLAVAGAPVAGRFDPFGRQGAFDLLYSQSRGPESSGEQARPMAIDADVVGEHVIVEARLFGRAGFWIEQVRDGLLAALQNGVSLRLGGKTHVSFEILDCLQRRFVPEIPIKTGREAVLAFRTPVRVRAGERTRRDPLAILWSAVTRVRGLAAWQEAELVLDELQLRAEAARLTFDDEDLTPMNFRRHSIRQGNVAIPVSGSIGKLVARGRLEGLTPFLTLGQYTHIGSHAALGFGRYDFAIYV